MKKYSTLAAKEADIMARWDAGDSIERIACSTRYSQSSVANIVQRYDGAHDRRCMDAKMRQGSRALLDALQGVAA